MFPGFSVDVENATNSGPPGWIAFDFDGQSDIKACSYLLIKASV